MTDFETFIIDKGLFSPEQIDHSRQSGPPSEPLYYRLYRRFPEKEREIWDSLAEFLQMDLLDSHTISLKPELSRLIPARIAHEYSIVPIARNNHKLDIAFADPRQFEKCQEIAMLISSDTTGSHPMEDSYIVIGHLSYPSHIAAMIKSLYGIGADMVQEMINETATEITVITSEIVDLSDKEPYQEDAAIVRFVNQLLVEAVQSEASDIHLEPYETDLRIRYRIDGLLRDVPVPDKIKHLESAIISRIKIMANLDIAEKRLPQDGQIRLQIMNRSIDIRVSVLPTMFGQGLVLRILDRQVLMREITNLGMPDDYLSQLQEVLKLTHGVILVTGPTGCGKTTTLYAAINEINSLERKIITVEDPIEYQLHGISQIHVKPLIGLTFAHILRSILRHDPDVIMVGEIRDPETAHIAISAAMTGHLVFSTLHTNDAPSAPVRLIEMGVEPYLISSALEATIAQRLVRVLCSRCKTRMAFERYNGFSEMDIIQPGDEIYESQGCPYCQHTGYKGRTAIFEMFIMNDDIREQILHNVDAGKIRQTALTYNMHTLKQSGLLKVKQGITTLSELLRVTKELSLNIPGRQERPK